MYIDIYILYPPQKGVTDTMHRYFWDTSVRKVRYIKMHVSLALP